MERRAYTGVDTQPSRDTSRNQTRLSFIRVALIDTTYSDPIPYDAVTPYVNETSILWSPPLDQPTGEIGPGTHRFPFRFIIPAKCPASFDGKHGFIRYHCLAKIERQRFKGEKTVKQMITVISTCDLNSIPNAYLPILSSQSKEIATLFFKNGQINLTVKLDKRGFVPAESVAIEATVINSSSQKINNIRIKILQRSNYKAFRGGGTIMPGKTNKSLHKNEDTKDVFKMEKKLIIEKGSSYNFARTILIPDIVASFKNCPIIKVEYFIETTLSTSGPMSTNVSVHVPVAIGTIPTREVTSLPMIPPVLFYEDILDQCPDAPPPYEECVIREATMKIIDHNEDNN